MPTAKSRVLPASAGLVAGALLTVTVYEGSVVLANDHGHVDVAAGSVGHVGGDQAPRVSATNEVRQAAILADERVGAPQATNAAPTTTHRATRTRTSMRPEWRRQPLPSPRRGQTCVPQIR